MLKILNCGAHIFWLLVGIFHNSSLFWPFLIIRNHAKKKKTLYLVCQHLGKGSLLED